MCIINKNPPYSTKSTCIKRTLAKSNVSIHENEKLPRNLVPLTKSTHSHAFSREHSTMILRQL